MTTAVAERTDQVECFGGDHITIPSVLITKAPDIEGVYPFPEPEADLRMFRIMNQADGDRRIIWNCRIIDELKAARQMFMDLLKKGMVPFRVGVDGQKSAEKMEVFDPTAEEVIFMSLAAVVGG